MTRTQSSAGELLRDVAAARDTIASHSLLQPHVALILGSGLGALADQVEHSTYVPYSEIPGFPQTNAVGHAGRLILGFLAGVPAVIMQGRAHRYEGFSNASIQFPIRCLRALGAHTLIATNAAGGLNPRFRTGDLMVLDGHIDFLFERIDASREPAPRPAPTAGQSEAYDYALIERVKSIARTHDSVLHQGCYLATLGPTYETRNEYRMFRWMGADAVGMSTVPEVLAARELGMKVLAFSVVTNVASTDQPQPTTHGEVIDVGNLAGPKLMKIVRQILEDWAGQPD